MSDMASGLLSENADINRDFNFEQLSMHKSPAMSLQKLHTFVALDHLYQK
jgi:hypothetical protein